MLQEALCLSRYKYIGAARLSLCDYNAATFCYTRSLYKMYLAYKYHIIKILYAKNGAPRLAHLTQTTMLQMHE